MHVLFVHFADVSVFRRVAGTRCFNARSYEWLALCLFREVELLEFFMDQRPRGMFLGTTVGELAIFFLYTCVERVSHPDRFSKRPSAFSLRFVRKESERFLAVVGCVWLRMLFWAIWEVGKNCLCCSLTDCAWSFHLCHSQRARYLTLSSINISRSFRNSLSPIFPLLRAVDSPVRHFSLTQRKIPIPRCSRYLSSC